MFVTAIESSQQIYYRAYNIMLNQHVFLNVYKLSCFGGVYALPFYESSCYFNKP